MGIKFQCPNGHALNVKTFLAGKRGICPHCQSKFIIPLESGGQAQPAPSKKHSSESLTPQNGTPAAGAHSNDSVSTPAAAPTPEQQPTVSSPALAGTNGETPYHAVQRSPLADASFQPTRGPIQYGFPANLPVGTVHPTIPVGTQLTDPIAEAPHAVWYVRPPSGGQFGPAVGEIMRTWITEGRVSADSWVWREGWPDWRQAGTVLPQLAPGTATTVAAAPADRGIEFPIGNPQSAKETTSSQVRVRSRRAANQLTLILVALLILVAIGLVGIFMWVVGQQKEDATARRDVPPTLAATDTISASSFSAARVASFLG